MTVKSQDFRNTMRKLWSDHVTWTRMFIVSFAAGLPDADFVTKRLLKNQEDIGDAIKPYYGESAGNGLAGLLKTHILIAIKILLTVRLMDKQGFNDLRIQWYKNADKIAAFLKSGNPNWNEDELKAMLYNHLNLTLEEAIARLNGKYEADIASYDTVVVQALFMADMLSEGIEKQFSEEAPIKNQ